VRNPVHPGEIVRHDCLEALAMSIDDAASALDIPPRSLHEIVNGEAPISADIAVRLAAVFGSTPETWLRMQRAYDQASQQARILNPEPS
jgi:antitoxin HigA-1